MGSLERVFERLVEMRTVECPRCKLEGKTVRVTVKRRKGKYCKTAKCPACGHRINVGFAEQYVEERVVAYHLKPVAPSRAWKGLPLPIPEKRV